MSSETLAFVYNRRRVSDPKDPRFHLEADYDDVKTIESIRDHLEHLGYTVLPIEADERAYVRLFQQREEIDLVFNYSLGMYGSSGYAQLPAMMEMLRLPYTGSSPLTQASIMNKGRLKEILRANGLPTTDGQVMHKAADKLKPGLEFPLIVKPVARGSSAGINNNSVVHNTEELRRQVTYVMKLFDEPALVEPFLSGREFSVPLVGNPPRMLPVIEPNFKKLPKRFNALDSLEIKWVFEEAGEGEDHLQCPAPIDTKIQKRLEEICFGVWEVLEIRDWCRMDVRANGSELYVLDVNSPPGMIPPEVSLTSYLPLSARAAGMDYEELLRLIIGAAKKRYGIK
ncbi:MAG: ATP-grasp domain-containing protein [Candidatus Chisholmbacteria bacterium]|nr:ATP-grasp domain-containing protein [Candidatus Chisholmbacteria bacterium]